MENIKDILKESKLDTLMDDISSLLTSKKIKFERINQYEILSDKKNKDKITKLIFTLDNINDDNFKSILQISDVGTSTCIRQRIM